MESAASTNSNTPSASASTVRSVLTPPKTSTASDLQTLIGNGYRLWWDGKAVRACRTKLVRHWVPVGFPHEVARSVRSF